MIRKIPPLIFSLFMVFLMSCHKEEVVNDPDSLIGRWKIDSMVFCVRPNVASSKIYHWTEMPDIGSILFRSDCTGSFVNPVVVMTDTISEFIWHHDADRGLLDFWFSNGSTVGVLKSISKDICRIYFRDYLRKPNGTDSFFYYLHLVKNK